MSYDKSIQDLFDKKKILTYQEVKEETGCCLTTLSRFGDKQGYYTSLNKNGKYYILKENCPFNKDGLYAYKGIKFSKYHTLKASLLHTIEFSKRGITTEELKKIYGNSTGVSVSHLYTAKKIDRMFSEGTFYYLSSDSEINSIQRQSREELLISNLEKLTTDDLPSQDNIIAILTLLVKKVNMTAKNIQKKLKKAGIHLSKDEIKKVLSYYKIGVKKK